MIKRIVPLLFMLAIPLAFATEQTSPNGVLSLSAQASTEVPQDIVYITLFHEQQAPAPAPLTETLKQKTDQALREAKTQKEVSVHTGTFTVYPSTNRDGRVTGWRGRTELLLESRDFAAAARLAGKLTSLLQIGDVRFALSPTAKNDAQKKLMLEAIAAFRAQAKSAAQAFGFGNYTIRQVSVNYSGIGNPRPLAMITTRSALDQTDVPLEAGKASVAVTVSGSVQMKR